MHRFFVSNRAFHPPPSLLLYRYPIAKSIEITKNERVPFLLAHFMSEFLQPNAHFWLPSKGISRRAYFFVYAAQFLRLCTVVIQSVIASSNRTELLLIYRIPSHTNPKRRDFSLKHAGQKSVKEELPKHRKGPKRTEECRLKASTHIWEQDAAGSNPVTRTNFLRKTAYLGGFSAFLVMNL